MSFSINITGLSKRYQLGLTHAGSVRDLVNRLARQVLTRKSANNDIAIAESDRVEDGHFWALRDVSFGVERGEVIGIIGKNGAGKSTLLKLLGRITLPTTGRAELFGRVASLLEVGTGFHPELTGRENVYLNGTILGMTRREIAFKMDDIIDFAGVSKFMDTPVKRYSSGMTVRLGFAVAAHLDPEILIVDEVLAVGDVEFQKRCLGKMQSVAESGKTVLFVSHNLASIRNLTKRTVVLSKGRLVFDGPTKLAIARYLEENLSAIDTSIAIVDAARAFSGLDRKLEFVDLEVSGRDTNGTFDVDDLFHLTATIRANDNCGCFLIGLTVYADDMTPVGSAFTSEMQSPAIGCSEKYHLHADFPLAPGRYHCAISISTSRSGCKHLHDSLDDIMPFEIASRTMDVRGWQPGWGMVQFPMLKRCLDRKLQSPRSSEEREV